MNKMKPENLTYDIYFHDGENSNNKGFEMSLEGAKAYIRTTNGTNWSYFGDYKGGIVQVVCNETQEVVHEEEIF